MARVSVAVRLVANCYIRLLYFYLLDQITYYLVINENSTFFTLQSKKKLLEQVINKRNRSSICPPVVEIVHQQTATIQCLKTLWI